MHGSRTLLKISTLVLALGLAAAPVRAQDPAPASTGFATTGGDPFAMGEKVVFAALSAGVWGVYGNTVVPPVQFGFDYAFHQYMTLGGMFGYQSYSYLKENLSYFTFAFRGTFHPIMWLTRVKAPIDPYGVAMVGYTHYSWSGSGDINSTGLLLGPGVGIRYWFTPNLSGQAESGVGNGLGLLSAGLALKF